jgi:hypothetical protein
VNPDGVEACDGVDDDCDGVVDPADALQTWYPDGDGDGFGDLVGGITACEAPAHYVVDHRDCDDGDGAVHPGAIERCDGIDDDCDPVTTDLAASDAATWYADVDADGHGDPDRTLTRCDAPTGYVASDDDCDDLDATTFPGAGEHCDAADNDCDGRVDEQAYDALSWWPDADGDGYGDGTAQSHRACEVPSGASSYALDCDDADPTVHFRAGDVLGDGVDTDCDGMDCAAGGTGAYFAVCPATQDFWTAESSCQGSGYEGLASIRDQAEDDAVAGLLADAGLGSGTAWFGYYEPWYDGYWVTFDWNGSAYTAWAPGAPAANGTADCAWIDGTGAWSDHDCRARGVDGFVCQSRL